MMKNLLHLLLSAGLLMGLTTGCSTQNRTAKPNLSDEELNQVVSELSTGSGISSTGLNSGGGPVYIYHAGDSKGRPASSVLALVDIGVIDPAGGWQPYTWSKDTTLAKADAVFTDAYDANGTRIFTLMIRMKFADDTGNLSSEVFYRATSNGEYSFNKDRFSVLMNDSAGQTLVVESTDLSSKFDDELGDAIKLKLYITDGSTDYYIGQVSTMAGYSSR